MTRCLVALLALVVVAAGCSGRVADAAPATPAAVQPGWTGCAAVGGFDDPLAPDVSGRGSVPTGFTPTRAVRCTTGERTAANGDLVGIDVEQTATDLDGLLDYLARPSEISGGDPDCLTLGWGPPALFLVDAERRWILPQIPTDVCGFGLDLFAEGGPAYDRLTYRDRVVRETEMHESAAARAANCAMAMKNVIAVVAADGSAGAAPVGTDPWPATGIRSCVYAVPAAERSSQLPVGRFEAGRRLTAARERALRAGVVAAPAAVSCRTPTRRFAELTATDGGGSVYLELDGCHRILVDDGNGPSRLAQGGPTLARLLVN